jgi:hypothetical protein
LIDALMKRSECLNRDLSAAFEHGPVNGSKRVNSSWGMCLIATEHANSLRQLVKCGNYTSATCILRLQFEALTRAIWLFYSASDQRVENMFYNLVRLSKHAEQQPNNADMIKSLFGVAPSSTILLVVEFRNMKWKELRSYVHAGIQAFQHHSDGYPSQFVVETIKYSNALLLTTAKTTGVLSGQDSSKKDILLIQNKYMDCFPRLLIDSIAEVTEYR